MSNRKNITVTSAVLYKENNKKGDSVMAKYSKKAQEKIGEVMHEFKKGKLKSSSGEKVTDHDQAVAIGISEAEHAGYKVPQKKEKGSPKTKE